MSEGGEKKEKWFPGKYMSRAMSTSGGGNGPRKSETGEHPPLGERGPSSRYSSNSTASATGPNSQSYVTHEYEPYPINHDNVEVIVTPEGPDIAGSGAIPQSVKEIPSNAVRPPAIARAKFKMLEMRYLTIQAPKVSIELDGVASVFQHTDANVMIEREFDLLDVTSDLKIEFRGLHINGNPVFGIVIIPVVSCLSFAGAPLPGNPQWREIYPYYEKLRLLDSPKLARFRSGFSDVPGSSMNKPVESLGFINCSLEIIPLSGKSGLPLYFAPSAPRSFSLIKGPDNDAEATDITMLLNNARMNRDIERLKNALFKPPAITAPFLALPDVFILLAAFGFMCCTFSTSQLPLVFFATMLFNGIWTNMNRKFSNVSVWNEIGGAMSISNALEDENKSTKTSAINLVSSTALSILKTNQSMQRQLSQIVHNIEVFNNLFTFADPRVSIIVYGILFIACIISSIWISIFSLGSFVFIVGSLVFISIASVEFLEDQIPQLHTTSIYHKHIAAFRKVYAFINILWSKVPDEMDLVHRHITSLCLVKELGGEMNDAANNFAARAAAKEKESK